MEKFLTYEYVKQYIESFSYKLLSKEYINAHTKMNLMCNNGHEYQVNFNNFKNGKRCPKCAVINTGNRSRTSFNEVKDFIKNNNYELLDDTYINSKTKLNLKCNNGHYFSMTYSHFKEGHRCPYCNGGSKFDYEYVKKYIEKENYSLISNDYTNVYEKLLIKCDKGHKYEVNFHNFRTGYRCPYCNESKGETNIVKILNQHNIKYTRQYRFEDCRNIFALPFDFYLNDYNICIEYDGRQHFKPLDFFGGQESYEKTVKNDNIKNTYCKNNNIKLLRISYLDKNIEDIMLSFIKQEELSTTIP